MWIVNDSKIAFSGQILKNALLGRIRPTRLFKGVFNGKKLTFVKELTRRLWTYELHGQGEKEKKRNVLNQDKQTPHTVVQKLSPQVLHPPLRVKLSSERGLCVP